MASEGLALPPIIAVVGPTASGKTELALSLARRLGGEIVSADMGQLYRRLDAGTAKPRGEWRGETYLAEGVPYHCVDVLDPSEPTDAGSYARRARPALERIRAGGAAAIVAGGTGLYVRALLEGLDEMPGRDPELRARLERRAEDEGREALHAELARRDPEAARRIPAGNLQRVVRALEVLEATGRPISELWTAGAAPLPAAPGAYEAPGTAGRGREGRTECAYFGLLRGAEELELRIRRRAEEMFPRMVREVESLVPAVYEGSEPGFRCLGYPQALAVARGETSQGRGLEEMIRATRAYAKRQRTWFRHQAPVRWLEPAGAEEEILRAIGNG